MRLAAPRTPHPAISEMPAKLGGSSAFQHTGAPGCRMPGTSITLGKSQTGPTRRRGLSGDQLSCLGAKRQIVVLESGTRRSKHAPWPQADSSLSRLRQCRQVRSETLLARPASHRHRNIRLRLRPQIQIRSSSLSELQADRRCRAPGKCSSIVKVRLSTQYASLLRDATGAMSRFGAESAGRASDFWPLYRCRAPFPPACSPSGGRARPAEFKPGCKNLRRREKRHCSRPS